MEVTEATPRLSLDPGRVRPRAVRPECPALPWGTTSVGGRAPDRDPAGSSRSGMRAGWPFRPSGTTPAGRLPLRGADLVLIAMQSLWARAGVSNNTLLVVQCDAPIAPERIRRALDRLLGSCPWPAARLKRPFPWRKLHWAAAPAGRPLPPPARRRSPASRP